MDKQQINDGGPAFPVADLFYPNGQVQIGSYGMTLRDWFAGQALQGLCAHYGFGELNKDVIDGHVYHIADAMIAARNKQP